MSKLTGIDDIFNDNGTSLLADASTLPKFRGARATLTTAFITSASVLAVTWASEDFDTDAIHDNATNNSRLTVPTGSGITKVIITANAGFGTPSSSVMQFFIRKNGTTTIAGQSEGGAFTGGERLSASTGPIDVVEGDYFEATIFTSVAGSITADAGSNFSMMVVETNEKGGLIDIPTEQTGTTYTTVLGDVTALVRMNNAAANTVTIPPDSAVAYPIGSILTIVQTGAGKTTLAPGTGVTILSADSFLDTRVQFSVVSLMKILVNTWILTGDLA